MADNTTMIQDKDGAVYAVPPEHVKEALASGGKVVAQVTDKDSTQYWVPLEHVNEALKSGATLTPPSMPGVPQPKMEESTLGQMYDTVVNAPTTGYAQANQGGGFTGATPDQNNSVLRGAEKGLTETASGVSHIVRHPIDALKGVDSPGLLGEQQASSAETETNGLGEGVGKLGEAIMEFVAGDEALKGLSLVDKTEKTLKAYKAAKVAAGESPLIARALQIGMSALRQGVVGGAQSLAHGEDIGTAAETGAITGATGGVMDAVGEAVPTAVKAISNKIRRTGVDQDVIQAGVHDAASAAANNATGDVFKTPASVRDFFSEASDMVEAKAKGLYKAVDDATGNRLTPVQTELNDITKKLRFADEAEASGLMKRQSELETKLEDIFQQSEKNGVPRDTIDKARAAYRQSAALSDVDRAVKMSTDGIRPDWNTNGSTPETVDPKKLLNRMQKLYDSGRLQDAFGGDIQHAKDLMKVLDYAKDGKSADVFTKVMDAVGKHSLMRVGVGALVGGGAGYQEGGFGGAMTGAAVGMTTGAAFSKVMLSAPALRMLRWGLENGAPSKTVIPAVLNALQVGEKRYKR